MTIWAAQLSAWLKTDIEIAQAAVSAEPPTSQRKLLLEAVRQVLNSTVNQGEAVKVLGIAQTILSGSYQLLSEEELAENFEKLINFFRAEAETEVNDRILAVAALLLSRMRKKRGRVSPLVTKKIDSSLSGTDSTWRKSTLTTMLARIAAASERSTAKSIHQGFKFNLDLNIAKAAENVRGDVEGDWYQDPWGWPEIEWLGTKHSQRVLDRLKSEECSWSVPIDVPKREQGVRPGMVINPLDRIAYQCLADELSIEAAGNLPDWVHGWRLARSRSGKGVYESTKSEWKIFSKRIVSLCNDFRFTAHIDIQSFFADVDISILLSHLGRRYRNAAVLDRLETFLESWHRCPNRTGIPQRALASCVLSHVVLQSVDVYLDRLSNGGRSKTFLASRWMDDIWLHSNNESSLSACVTEIEGILAQLRLSLNSEKTEVFESKDAGRIVQLVDTYGTYDDSESVSLSELLERTEGAPRFQIGLEVSKMLLHSDFSSLDHISIKNFSQISYLGDKLARPFRVSGNWKRFAGAYLDFTRRHQASENLSIASWGEMFPNDPTIAEKSVHDCFSNLIVNKSQRLLAPLAAQRLVAWHSKFGLGNLAGLDVLNQVRDQGDMFKLRALSFASLMASPSSSRRADIYSVINQTDDELTVAFLKDHQFSPPELSARFRSE